MMNQQTLKKAAIQAAVDRVNAKKDKTGDANKNAES